MLNLKKQIKNKDLTWVTVSKEVTEEVNENVKRKMFDVKIFFRFSEFIFEED